MTRSDKAVEPSRCSAPCYTSDQAKAAPDRWTTKTCTVGNLAGARSARITGITGPNDHATDPEGDTPANDVYPDHRPTATAFGAR